MASDTSAVPADSFPHLGEPGRHRHRHELGARGGGEDDPGGGGGGPRFEILEREKDMVRLGSSAGDMRELSPDAIDRAVAALDRFRQVAAVHDAPDHGGGHLGGAGGREPRRADRPGLGRGRGARRRDLGRGGGSPHPPRCPAGRADLRQARAALRHRRREHRAARRPPRRGAGRPVVEARRHPPHPALLRRRSAAPERRRCLPALRAIDARPVRPRGAATSTSRWRSGSSGTIAALAEMAAVRATGARPRSINNQVLTRDELDGIVVELDQGQDAGRAGEPPGPGRGTGRHHPGGGHHPRAGAPRPRHPRAGRLGLRPPRRGAARCVAPPSRWLAPPPLGPAPAQRARPRAGDGRGSGPLGPGGPAGPRPVRRDGGPARPR